MSNYILTDAFLAKVGGMAEKIVLVSLADQANDHGVCWPGVETIAERASASVRTVKRILRQLEAGGHISVLSRREGGRPGSTTVYRVHPVRDPELEARLERRRREQIPDFDQPRAARRTGDTVSRVRPARRPEEQIPGVESFPTVSETGATVSKTGDTVSPKPSLTIMEPGECAPAHASARTREGGEASGTKVEHLPAGFPWPEKWSAALREAVARWLAHCRPLRKPGDAHVWITTLIGRVNAYPEGEILAAIDAAILAGWTNFYPQPDQVKRVASPTEAAAREKKRSAEKLESEREAELMAAVRRLYPAADAALRWRDLPEDIRNEARAAVNAASLPPITSQDAPEGRPGIRTAPPAEKREKRRAARVPA